MATPEDINMQMRAAHLAMIQGVINRIAGNSSSAKIFCVTLLAGLLAFYSQKQSSLILLAGIFAPLLFMLLDAKYLLLERGFRDLYNSERVKTAVEPCDFKIAPSEFNLCGYVKIIFSWSVLWFYILNSVIFICLFLVNYLPKLKAILCHI